ncbi:hypothetical protein FB45DRAFT_1064891 [Roridomyces roridus]|uniref:Uncharacterized protein n=1 Tax=Roridomyces roridus TaxID=1738132 RepID=A0AAD7B8L1_9AGAR|nr:hypothetical protein FB45DRAFT_1064891 [Roridomyces roridus]
MDRSDTVYLWAVLTPSPRETVAYLDSELALSAADEVECRTHLTLIVTKLPLISGESLRAYLVQPRDSEDLETFYPIHPSTADSRPPIIPPPSFSSFGECVVDTTRGLFVTASYTNEPDACNGIPMDTLGAFATQRREDFESELRRDYQRKSAEAREGLIEVGDLDPDAPSQDYYGVWTAFSVRSRAARKAHGALQALADIHVAVSFDLSTVRQLFPARRFIEEELTIQRLRARFSRYGTERAILWVRDQSEHPCCEPMLDNPIEDLCHPELIELSASLEHPEDLPENPSAEEDCSDLAGHFGAPLPRMGREMQLPPPPYVDPGAFKAISFDVFVFIDHESGIWDALQPLLSRSQKNLTRLEVLSLYFDIEREIKDDPPHKSDLPLLHRTHQRFSFCLGLTCTPSESATFAASIANWSLVPGAVECLQRIHPYYHIYVLAHIDKESILSCVAFNLIHPYLDGVALPFPEYPTYRPHFGSSPVPVEDLKKLPPSASCFVSTSVFQDIEPARFFSMPSLWVRRPGSLAASAPDDLIYTASEVCDSFASMLPLFVGGVSGDIEATDEVLNDGIESHTLTPTEVSAD